MRRLIAILILLLPVGANAAITVTISEPSTSPYYSETSSVSEISGTVVTDSDDPVTSVTFSCSTCTPEYADIYYDIDTGTSYWAVYNVDISIYFSNEVTVSAASYDSETDSDSITIVYGSGDGDAPTITSFVIPSSYNSLTVPISYLTATDNVAVTGYLLSYGACTTPAYNDPGWEYPAPSDYTFPSAGSYTMCAWAKDAANNISSAAYDSVVVSLEPETPGVPKPITYNGNAINYGGWIVNYAD